VTNEVLAAAERRRRALNRDRDVYRHGGEIDDAMIIADAALADGLWQADDGFPLGDGYEDEFMGPRIIGGFESRLKWIAIGYLVVEQSPMLGPGADSSEFESAAIPCTTRGQLRQLLKAIGGGDGK